MASMHCYKPAQRSYYQEQEEFSYSEEETANWSRNGHSSHHGGFQGYTQKESYIESDRSQCLNNGMNKSHARYGYGQADYPNGCNAYGTQYYGYDKAAAMAEGGEGMGQAYGNHKASHGMMIYEEKTKVKGEFKTGQFERINLNRSDDSCSDIDDECDEEYRGRRKYHCR